MRLYSVVVAELGLIWASGFGCFDSFLLSPLLLFFLMATESVPLYIILLIA